MDGCWNIKISKTWGKALSTVLLGILYTSLSQVVAEGFLRVVNLVKVAMFGMALVGYGCHIKRRTGLKEELLPITVIAALGSVMYIAGILNFMELGVYAIFFGGIWIFMNEFSYIQFKPTTNRIIFLGLLCYLAYFCWGGVYADGDTMTHWGVIVRETVELDRLPNFSTQEVAYQSYPPGTAMWIYLVCKLIGYSEGYALVAQGIMVCSALFTLFSLVGQGLQKNNRIFSIWQYIILLGAVIYMLQYNIRLDSLQVDHVLSVLCIAGMCIIICTRDDASKMFISMLPLLLYLPIIKNIGILYSSILVIIMAGCYLYGKDKMWKEKIGKFIVFAVLPTIVFTFLWSCHTDMVYMDADMTRHSASISYMVSVAEAKSMEELQTIANNFLKVWFSLDPRINATREWWLIGGMLLMAAISKFALGVKKIHGDHTSLFLLSTLGLYVAYKVMLLGMYMFNMPDEDAIYIGAYQRYMEGILVLIFFLTIVYCMHIAQLLWNSDMKKQIKVAFLTLLLVMTCLYPAVHTAPFTKLMRPDYQHDGLYRQLKVIKDEYCFPEKGAKVLVYTKTPYAGFFIQYCFRSFDAWGIAANDFERAMETTPDFYDYLLIMDTDDEIENVVRKYGYQPGSVVDLKAGRSEAQ